jgi:hypothetical protein
LSMMNRFLYACIYSQMHVVFGPQLLCVYANFFTIPPKLKLSRQPNKTPKVVVRVVHKKKRRTFDFFV